MIGNPFSPFYFDARREGRPRAAAHAAVNVALYGPRQSRWALTEGMAPHRTRDAMWLGRSSLAWCGDALSIEIDERCAPWPRRLQGRLTVRPTLFDGEPRALDASGRHTWTPLAPLARVDVELFEPSLRFRGHGYLDHNVGHEPLEAAFRSWRWSRVEGGGRADVAYEVTTRDDEVRRVDLSFDALGAHERAPSVSTTLPGTRWWLPRVARGDSVTRVVRTLEDTPFYARSEIATEKSRGVHEVLDLDRFVAPWVRRIVPMRMRRVG